jgi:hypothetical protein
MSRIAYREVDRKRGLADGAAVRATKRLQVILGRIGDRGGGQAGY